MWKRILKYLIGAVTIVSLVIGTQVVTAETGLIVKLPKPITNIASELGQSFTLGMVGVAYATTPDYICDGVADDVEIQAAMNALPATGGELFFFGGNYVLTATVTRAINNISIVGSGKSTYFANDGGTALFSAGAQAGWQFSNLRTDAGWLTLAADTVLLNVTNSTDFISVGRTSTINIAASNASDQIKGQSDIICDGVSDEVQINAALIDVSALGGGTITLSEGIFYLGDNITLTDNITLQGQGTSTRLVMTDNESIIVGVNLGSQPDADGGVTVRDLFLDGDNYFGSGIYLNGVCFSTFENIWMEQINGNALSLRRIAPADRNTAFNVFKHIRIYSGYYLMTLYGTNATDVVTDNYFEDISWWSYGTKACNGIIFNRWCDSNVFNKIHLFLNFAGSIGVIFNSGDSLNDIGVYRENFTDLIIEPTVAATTSIAIGHTAGYGHCYVDRGIFVGTNASAPSFADGADSDVVFRNTILDTGLGAYSYSENKGTATILSGGTSIVVNHGCWTTPSRVIVTPRENPTNAITFWWVDTITATQFTIHASGNPGASNLDFDWEAYVSNG